MNFKNLETIAKASKRTRGKKLEKQVESVFFFLSYKATAILVVGLQCSSRKDESKGKNQMT